MRSDIVIVGGGYWGTAIAFEARRAGRSVVVLDDADPAAGSRNASAIAHIDTYDSPIFQSRWPSDWTKSELIASIGWLVEHCGAVETPEHFINLTRSDLAPRASKTTRPPLYLHSNDDLLGLVPKTAARVSQAFPDGEGWMVETSAGFIYGRALVLAGGYRTDGLLEAVGEKRLGVGALFGRGLVVRGRPTVPVPSMLMTRPYTKFALRPWGDAYRFGDTAEVRRNDRRADELRALAAQVVSDVQEVGWMTGFRPVLPQFTLAKLRTVPPLVVATGGHRMAMGLAGLVAKRTLSMLT